MPISRHILLTAILAALPAVAATGLAESAQPRCFGAAARDPLHPCINSQLLRAVAPRPSAALLETDAPCSPFRRPRVISVCYFGGPATQARESIAILGDSHATHWRPALEVVAGAKAWRGASLTRTSCPFARGTPSRLSPA